MKQFSSFTRLKRVTAWIMRFVGNCHTKGGKRKPDLIPCLSVIELKKAEVYWLAFIQEQHFQKEVSKLKKKCRLHRSSPLIPLHPFLDADKLIRVGGREQNSNRAYSNQHPIILHGTHLVTRLIIRSEHTRLLHAGPTLLSCSLNRRYHLIGGRKAVRTVTRACVTCRRVAAKPQEQMMGQLPAERVTPDVVFSRVGIDYAGPLQLKLGSIRKPTIVKSYVCVFVSLSVRAVIWN